MTYKLHQAAQKAVEALKRLTDGRGGIARFDRTTGHAGEVRELIEVLESALQQHEAAAEIDRDDDGELLIDWSPGAGRMLTLSLRNDGRLSYAFTWDGEKSHGTAQMPSLSTTRQQEVGSGWKLVPVEPTEEMLARGTEHFLEPHTPANNTLHVYRAMLAAAPSTPSTPQRKAK